jgi:hypothetical protein
MLKNAANHQGHQAHQDEYRLASLGVLRGLGGYQQ